MLCSFDLGVGESKTAITLLKFEGESQFLVLGIFDSLEEMERWMKEHGFEGSA